MITELVKQNGGNKNGPWSTFELATLRRMANMGAPTIAEALNRSEQSVRMMAHYHRISLRRLGSTRGLVMGQPRSVGVEQLQALQVDLRVWAAMRAKAIDGKLDINRLEEIAGRARAIANGAPLCPGCTRNPQEVDTTGLCRDCHVRRLAEAHTLSTESPAQRELWAARQAKTRRRRREEAAGLRERKSPWPK